MDTFEAVKTMLAVRDYREDSIPEEVITRIVEAGRLTGSAMNRQNWDFVVIKDKQMLQRLGDLASTGSYIARAPLAVAVLVSDTPWGPIDGARAAQDMMLVAWEEGVGSNWVGNVNSDSIRQLLDAPEDRVVLTVIPFGYPAKAVKGSQKDRKPAAEVVHLNKFGQPYRGS